MFDLIAGTPKIKPTPTATSKYYQKDEGINNKEGCIGRERQKAQLPEDSFNHVEFVLQFFGKLIQILAEAIFEICIYRQQFSFVVSLICRLTEEFEITCLPEKLLTLF